MDILDEAKKALQSLADSATGQVDYMKLQARLGKLETELERQLQEVGKRARDLYRMRQISDRQMGVLMKRIDEIEEQIEELREQGQQHGEDISG